MPEVWNVKKMIRENGDTFTMELTHSKNKKMKFSAGQFNMLLLPGVGESAISISAYDHKKDTLIHTIRSVGPVTQALSRLKKGDEVALRGPFGTAWPVKKALTKNVHIVCGGIGLAPLRPFIYELLNASAKRAKLGLETHIYYGARSPKDRIYVSELKAWNKVKGFFVRECVDQGTRLWKGPLGVVTSLIQGPLKDVNESIGVLCGPEIMMRFSAQKLISLGLNDQDIYLSMERNMKCAVALCGHCQFGPHFICKDGPVFTWTQMKDLLSVREL